MMSIFGSSLKVSAGAVSRFGPRVNKNGTRIPMRANKTGSVKIFTPKKLISTVECPSQAAVTRASLHFAGFGLVNASAIGSRLFNIASRHKYDAHRCTRGFLKFGFAELIFIFY